MGAYSAPAYFAPRRAGNTRPYAVVVVILKGHILPIYPQESVLWTLANSV